MLKKYKKSFFILGVFFIISVVSYFFREDLIRWTCHEEDNAASCYIIGDNLLKENKPALAKSYLEKSCRQNYRPACDILKKDFSSR